MKNILLMTALALCAFSLEANARTPSGAQYCQQGDPSACGNHPERCKLHLRRYVCHVE